MEYLANNIVPAWFVDCIVPMCCLTFNSFEYSCVLTLIGRFYFSNFFHYTCKNIFIYFSQNIRPSLYLHTVGIHISTPLYVLPVDLHYIYSLNGTALFCIKSNLCFVREFPLLKFQFIITFT